MGKKGSWISSIKRLFSTNHNPVNDGHKKSKDKGRGRFKHGSFFPLCREPSSIEQILGDIDQHNLYIPTTQPHPQPQPRPQQQQPQPQPQPQQQPQPQPQQQQQQQPQPQPQRHPQQQPRQKQPQSQTHPQSQSQPLPPPQPQPQSKPQQPQPQPQPQPQSLSQPQPQRKQQPSSAQRLTSTSTTVHQQPNISHRPEPTLQQRHLSATRIQAVYRGHMARRNTRNLTGLVRLQKVVTSKNVKRQTVNAMKQMQLLVRVQTQIRSRRIQMLENQAPKPQPNKDTPHKQSDEDEHWDDSVITKEERDARLQRKADAAIKRERAMAYAYSHQVRKDTPTSAHKTSGYPLWWKWVDHQLPYHTTPTPKNHQVATTPSRSTHKQLDTPTTPTSSRSSRSTNRWIKARKAPSLYSMKDDDSLRSCPPFSVPNYMSPTASARAKARPTSNPKERCATPTTPCSESSKRRFSSPFTPRSNRSPGSVGNLSINSSVGRKPFNRFV